jgi:hypothetical protein
MYLNVARASRDAGHETVSVAMTAQLPAGSPQLSEIKQREDRTFATRNVTDCSLARVYRHGVTTRGLSRIHESLTGEFAWFHES